MKTRELKELGIQRGKDLKLAQSLMRQAAQNGLKKRKIRDRITALIADPELFTEDSDFAPLALSLTGHGHDTDCPEEDDIPDFIERDEPAPWRQWGDDLEAQAVQQMANACRLPISVSGALMPDAHMGYGLPIGGVLACDNAVIPYAVGVDIACRMKLTVYDIPAKRLEGLRGKLSKVLEGETRFGIGASFKKPHDHAILEDPNWNLTDLTRKLKPKARKQLGSSGSGNHFVEFGTLKLDKDDLGIPAGEYIALLSHSGSRGSGATIAGTYSKRAMARRPELPKELKHLAWLDMDTEEGLEYWESMQLMGRYAAANHDVIHREIARALGEKVIADVENHHNFAWKEIHDNREVIVHRKGATPAGAGVLGIIPGSMATAAFVVRGRGERHSLRSASHGAGRIMSRTKAKKSFTWSDAKKFLRERQVTLLSAGLDEVPGVYKDIHTVMNHQRDLVEKVAQFQPRIVKMAPSGEPPED